MSKEKLGQEPAFPGDTLELGPGGEFKYHETGISKRFYAACAAMQGLIMNFPKERMVNDGYISETEYTEIIRESYELADELLKQENQ